MSRLSFAMVMTWVLWTIIALSLSAAVSSEAYARVRFDLNEGTTGENYSRFIKDVRDNLFSGSLFHGIPQLRQPTMLASPTHKFLLVELSAPSFDSSPLPIDSIILAIDPANANVLAYRAGQFSYYFRDASFDELRPLFLKTKPSVLLFNNSYADLQRYANRNRRSIKLGYHALKTAIRRLRDANWDPESNEMNSWEEGTAACLIVVVQMVTEAARFKDIEWRVSKLFDNDESFLPDAFMLDLEDSWLQLSTQVQQSNQGVFNHPVRLSSTGEDGAFVEFSSARDIIPHLALMQFICRNHTSQYEVIPPLLMPVVPESSVASNEFCTLSEPKIGFSHDDLPGSNAMDGVCMIPEPTVSIVGRDGLCADVTDRKYDEGILIQLQTCNAGSNQLWTLKRDGTIQANGKCLTTNISSHGNYVTINDCDTALAGATHWKISSDGTISNPESELVLSVESGSIGTTLTLQTNTYAPTQGWLLSFSTRPLVASIVSTIGLCLRANGDSVSLMRCAMYREEHKWAVYADGSIRPKQNQDQCLSTSMEKQIALVSCSTGSQGQRWVLTNEGTILNLSTGLVIDVNTYDSTLPQITASKSKGLSNQKWLRVF